MSKVVSLYRTMNALYKKKIPLVPSLLQKTIRLFFSAEIPKSCELGKDVELKHGGLGIVIHHNAVIGDNTVIYQHVTIAGAELTEENKEKRRFPIIGRNCLIGTGAFIMGGITIGDNVRIGANAVVLTDIPSNSTAVGVPARILNKKSPT